MDLIISVSINFTGVVSLLPPLSPGESSMQGLICFEKLARILFFRRGFISLAEVEDFVSAATAAIKSLTAFTIPIIMFTRSRNKSTAMTLVMSRRQISRIISFLFF